MDILDLIDQEINELSGIPEQGFLEIEELHWGAEPEALPLARGKTSSKTGLSGVGIQPGDCESCPACGMWPEHGDGPFCFYEAYFLGSSAGAQLAGERRSECPLEEHKPYEIMRALPIANCNGKDQAL